MPAAPLTDILGTLAGCMGCMVVVENIAKQQPSAMNLMTFATFFFTASVGLVVTAKFFTVPNKIPLKGYLPTVSVFFLVNVINNQALNFHVPVPLHIIFRSGSLLASLLLSVMLERKRYSLRKYLSVVAITLGIIMCTLATASQEKRTASSTQDSAKHYSEWIIGISMLTFALIASAYLAICQKNMYAKYGKHPEEAMFVIHALSLPAFLFFSSDIRRAASVFTAAPGATLLGTPLPISSLWLNLLASCLLQWVCIHFVYNLNASVEPLTVTLVVTLRKFLSLVLSIVYFENVFTLNHWMGAFFVFMGTLAFADVWKGASAHKLKSQ